MASDPRVRETGRVEDFDGMPLVVGVDFDTVTLGHGRRDIMAWRLTQAQAEEFARLYLSACWQAAHQAGEMAAEAVRDG